ncbi:MarR family winged helix-turn-helix transcriptional regulator [Agromyces archimandritae]|uniref:MarR family transcriptional regulator n=1 Tax=Agromyces archimandritae TaxID=2781962 RepID=A0A975FKD8_9MICO|nr:MarR family transcriptional regulator [Agromyces archimandritae]QTX03537.1 MarR family transcriptional regulator [Agromyces archimandritae]
MAKTIAEQSTELRMAVFRLSRRIRAQKADQALSDAQFAVLGGLNRHGTQTLTQLAESEKVSAPSMNRTVNCLEEAGYLVREPDAADRRKTNISLSDDGRALVKATLRKRDAWLTERLRELSKEERETIARAVELIGGIATQ